MEKQNLRWINYYIFYFLYWWKKVYYLFIYTRFFALEFFTMCCHVYIYIYIYIWYSGVVSEWLWSWVLQIFDPRWLNNQVRLNTKVNSTKKKMSVYADVWYRHWCGCQKYCIRSPTLVAIGYQLLAVRDARTERAVAFRRWWASHSEKLIPWLWHQKFQGDNPGHDTLQFCMDWTVGDRSVAVCIEVGCRCVEHHHAGSEHLCRVTALLILKKILQRGTRRRSRRNPGLCEVIATIC